MSHGLHSLQSARIVSKYKRTSVHYESTNYQQGNITTMSSYHLGAEPPPPTLQRLLLPPGVADDGRLAAVPGAEAPADQLPVECPGRYVGCW
jgi:hypothetical protein